MFNNFEDSYFISSNSLEMKKKIESENLPSLKLTPIMSFANLYTRIKFVILCGKEEKQKLTVMIIKV